MPISLSTMAVTTALVMMVAVRATVGMTTVTATVIETEIISSIKSLPYRAGHSGHRKIQVIKIINKNTDKEGIIPNTVYRKNNKVGFYCDRHDHPLETLTGIGSHAFSFYEYYRDRCDHPCPLSAPDNTALRTASLQIPSSEGMATIQLGPMKKLDCRRSEELSGSLKRQGSGRFCPNPNPLHRQKEFPEVDGAKRRG